MRKLATVTLLGSLMTFGLACDGGDSLDREGRMRCAGSGCMDRADCLVEIGPLDAKIDVDVTGTVNLGDVVLSPGVALTGRCVRASGGAAIPGIAWFFSKKNGSRFRGRAPSSSIVRASIAEYGSSSKTIGASCNNSRANRARCI